MYCKILAVLAAITSLCCTSVAAAQNLDTTKAIRIGAESVRTIADSLDLKTSFSTYLEEKVLLVENASGLKTIVTFVGCKDEEALADCDGMEMRALWEFPTNGTPQEISRRLFDFNSSFRAAKTGTIDDNQVYMARYIIADYGTNQGNLAVEFAVFSNLGDKFIDRVLLNEAL